MSLFENETEEHWIPLADIMTGLMLIFLFIAFSYIVKIRGDTANLRKMHELAVSQKAGDAQAKKQIYIALVEEFKNDLTSWQAEVNQSDLTVNFYAPEVLFDTGQAILKPRFKGVLKDFLPRYLKVLRSHEGNIAAVSVDGYASAVWGNLQSTDQIYLDNLQLSQHRSLNVLLFLHQIAADNDDLVFLRNHFTTSSFSSMNAIHNNDGSDNLQKSQRVEFKIIFKGTK